MSVENSVARGISVESSVARRTSKESSVARQLLVVLQRKMETMVTVHGKTYLNAYPLNGH